MYIKHLAQHLAQSKCSAVIVTMAGTGPGSEWDIWDSLQRNTNNPNRTLCTQCQENADTPPSQFIPRAC